MEQTAIVLDFAKQENVLDIVMKKHERDIYQLVLSYVHDPITAEDLTQDIFLKVYKSLHTFKQKSKMKTWIWRIAVNHCNDYLKSAYYRKVTLTEDSSLLNQVTTNDVEQLILRGENANIVDAAVLNLPIKYRKIIFLHYYEEKSLQEIEAITGINRNTIKVRIHRAKKLLQNELIEIAERESCPSVG